MEHVKASHIQKHYTVELKRFGTNLNRSPLVCVRVFHSKPIFVFVFMLECLSVYYIVFIFGFSFAMSSLYRTNFSTHLIVNTTGKTSENPIQSEIVMSELFFIFLLKKAEKKYYDKLARIINQ